MLKKETKQRLNEIISMGAYDIDVDTFINLLLDFYELKNSHLIIANIYYLWNNGKLNSYKLGTLKILLATLRSVVGSHGLMTSAVRPTNL